LAKDRLNVETGNWVIEKKETIDETDLNRTINGTEMVIGQAVVP